MEQDGQSTTTRLLTLLNVSATKSIKRKRPIDDSEPTEKLNKRRTVQDVTPTEDVGEKEEEMVVDASGQQNPDPVDLADNAGPDEGNGKYPA
jgi:U3 small nucleolar RNA-associated protein 25